MANGRKTVIKDTDEAFKSGLMEVDMKAIGKKIKRMSKES